MNKILRSVLLLAAIAVIPAAEVLTQTTSAAYVYTFPGVETPGLQLVISNINTTDAIVKVTLYSPNGSEARSLRFPMTAGTQIIVDDGTVTLPGFFGTVVVESATPVAVSISINRGNTLESVSGSIAGADLVIPFVRAGANADTTVGLFNTGGSNADVLLILGKANGALLNGSRTMIGPKESRFLSLNSLAVPRADLDGVTHVFVRSLGNVLAPGRPVAAVGTVRRFDTGNGVVREDAGTVQALQNERLSSVVLLPLFVQGFGYFTQLSVVNPTDFPESVTLTARGASGAPVSGVTNPTTVNVPAHGSFSGNALQIFNLRDESMGSIQITGSGPLAAVGALGAASTPSLAVIGPADAAATTFALQYRLVSRESFSGLTFLNSNAADADLSLSFVGNDGASVSRAQLTVPALNQTTRTLADMLPEADGTGFLFINSSRAVQAAAIEGPNDAIVLTPLPASVVTTAFTPRPQQKFLAVGTARVSGEPVPGATVKLAGPVLSTRVTDSAGAFVFRDIPPGSYTATISMPGIAFTPSSLAFSITNANRRDLNFDGTIAASNLTSITPASVLVGTPQDFQITAKGGPFIPTSELVFEGNVIPTRFVNDTTLTGTISAALLQFARTTTVQVRNRVGLNVSPSQPLPFVIGNAAPVISVLEGVPAQIIAGYPGFTVTVNGTGFAEGGTVEFNGVRRASVWESPTKVRAFIDAADLAVGRIASLTATNPSPTVGPSNGVPVTVLNPVAGVTAVSPNKTQIKIEPNSTGLQLIVDGFQFKPGATVQVQNFAALNTTYVSSTRLIADIPPRALETGGSFPVTVSNPPPNLGSSEAQPLIVENLLPRLTSLDTGVLTFTPGVSAEATLPVNFIVVAHGANFGKTYSAVLIAPSDPWPSCDQKAPEVLQGQRVSSTEMVLTVPIKCRGNFSIYVGSPQDQPGGGTSALIGFQVVAPTAGPVPTITSLSPASIGVGQAFTLVINGSNFAAGALVNFGTAILTPNPADITSTQIRVSVPAYYVQEKGLTPVTVTNPGTGGTSARILFTVN